MPFAAFGTFTVTAVRIKQTFLQRDCCARWLVSPRFPYFGLCRPGPPLPSSHTVPLRLSFVHLASKDKLLSAVSPHADQISLKERGPQSRSTALVWVLFLCGNPLGRISSICLPRLFFALLFLHFFFPFFARTGTEIDKQIVTEGKRD